MSILFIGLVFSFAFFVESIVGFGGTLVAYAILGFFIDIKDLILIGLGIATASSIFILSSDYKSFKKEVFIETLPYCLFGTILGVVLFVSISSDFLLKLFGAFLVVLSFKTFFFDQIKFPKMVVRKVLVMGGFSQGVFGIGGPFFVSVLKGRFGNKSELRATMASFFIFYNVARFFQLSLTGNFDFNAFYDYWWVAFPLIIGIHLGHKIHVKISEVFFKNAIALLTLVSGVGFFFK